MTSTSLRLLGRTLVATCAVISTLAGCGDGPVCQVESLVFISSPQGPIITDSDPRVDGIQQDVVVKSTFSGAAVTLTVTDADDAVVATLTGRTDDDGNFTFADVTIPTTGASLRVDADAGQCGNDSDEVAVALIGGGDCAIAFATPPVANPFYAPLDVWNAAADADPATAGFQGDTLITARPGEQVKLFLSAPGVPETEVAAGTVGDTGTVSLATSAPEGQVNLRAECGVADGVTSRSSGVTSIFVDTVAPACAMLEPIPGTSITPGLDANNDLSDGIQVTLRGAGDGGDGEGETASFTITEPGGGTTALVGTDRDATGQSTAAASFDPVTSPADYAVRFATADHAGNACMVDQAYRVVLAGCTITVSAPTGTVTTDADGDATNGAQVDITASAPECVGQTITSDCGSTDPSVVVGAGGAIALRATVCDGVPCEATEMCTLRVTSTDGIETTAGVDLAFDNLAPNVAVTVSQPVGVACGGTVTPAQDQDAAAAGVQVRMRVTAPLSVSRSLDVTSGAGTVTLPVTAPGGEVFATIVPGANTMVGHATDGAGNIGTSVNCVVNLADIAVNFTGSPADGTVGGADGTVSGSTLTFALTGTASVAGATVTVTVDGGAPQAATVTGTAWSLTLALAGRAAPYTIVATATLTPRTGSATLPLVVDLTPPGTPTGLTAIADTRQSIRLGFTAPAGAASYRVKFATTALTDANFDATGTAVTAPTPGAAGSAETVRVRPLRAGTAYWVAVASVDDAGNRSAAQIAGPLTPRFDQAAVVGAPNTVGDAGFGLAMVRGKFNDDDFEDVAVSAPFVTAGGVAGAGEVYVFFGSATGLAATPGVTIRGVTADAAFGSALTAVRWSSTTRSDLVVGEPFGDGGSGAIYVWNGGVAFPTGAITPASAPRRIGAATTANWFSGSALGWQLAAADHDGDGTDDLITTAVFGNAGAAGAALVFYGGTVPTGTVRISDTSAAGSGTAVVRMYEEVGFNLFGYYLHNVGPTTGVADVADDLAVGYAEDGVAGADVVVLRSTGGRPAAPGVTREPFTIGRDVRVHANINDTSLEWGSTVSSVTDRNGNGARELVFGDYRYAADAGIVVVVDGGVLGTAGVHTIDPFGTGTLTTIAGTAVNARFGMQIVNNANGTTPDVDGDGIEDLLVVGTVGGVAAMNVWFGPVPLGVQPTIAPDHQISGPASFGAAIPGIGGSPITAIWAGDVNADGLDDVCWADWTSNGRDGGLQLLWDDGM